jgi:hypothetical protein
MNLLQTTNAKKMFATLAKGAKEYTVKGKAVKKSFENIKDAIATFEMICDMSEGELTIVSTSMHNNYIHIMHSYFDNSGKVTNQIILEAFLH